MATTTIIVEQVSTETGPLNPSVNTFAFTGTGLVIQEMAARVAMYSLLSVGVCRTDTAISRLSYRGDDPTGPTVPIPWPTTEWSLLWADLNATFQAAIPLGTSYNSSISRPVNPSIRGGSVCVNEVLVSPGTIRAGRHFQPFLSVDAVDADGLITTETATTLRNLYRSVFLGDPASTWWSTTPDAYPVSTWSPKNGLAVLIEDVLVQRIPSRLRSRTR